MSAYHEIFVRSKQAGADLSEHPDALLSDLATVVGAPFAPISDDLNEYIDFAAKIETAAIEVELTHDFEDDRDMPFSQYSIFFTIRDFGSDKKREEKTARSIFEKLCALGRYSLLLVYDGQRRLDSC
jgi:hypothetical protein